MIKEDEVIKLDDNKEYYVLDSIIKNDNNFIMIGEINDKDEITNNIKIMYYDKDNNKARKITDPTLLFSLITSFMEKN